MIKFFHEQKVDSVCMTEKNKKLESLEKSSGMTSIFYHFPQWISPNDIFIDPIGSWNTLTIKVRYISLLVIPLYLFPLDFFLPPYGRCTI